MYCYSDKFNYYSLRCYTCTITALWVILLVEFFVLWVTVLSHQILVQIKLRVDRLNFFFTCSRSLSLRQL
ncbi:hypothetical protein L6452_20368 [Arctium lappa]|uniref:Uncharacterized protein n=1 Tax=Arctium lappa TaxID=4217 RepID=A0ACB9BC15_ARCLA|nr:hypothetical protein L6452_20368 [Arctium lappa]